MNYIIISFSTSLFECMNTMVRLFSTSPYEYFNLKITYFLNIVPQVDWGKQHNIDLRNLSGYKHHYFIRLNRRGGGGGGEPLRQKLFTT